MKLFGIKSNRHLLTEKRCLIPAKVTFFFYKIGRSLLLSIKLSEATFTLEKPSKQQKEAKKRDIGTNYR